MLQFSQNKEMFFVPVVYILKVCQGVLLEVKVQWGCLVLLGSCTEDRCSDLHGDCQGQWGGHFLERVSWLLLVSALLMLIMWFVCMRPFTYYHADIGTILLMSALLFVSIEHPCHLCWYQHNFCWCQHSYLCSLCWCQHNFCWCQHSYLSLLNTCIIFADVSTHMFKQLLLMSAQSLLMSAL